MSNKKNDNWEGQELFTIFVETLTGTTFEIKVSPQDRVRSLKYKIQRVEGIPVSHQHLLYNMKELKDNSCVTDPTVGLRDHATVKLVLSMRGGPISLVHQTVPFSRTTLRSLVKLNRREEIVDELPPGCKMAVLVLRVGDQLNLLHVVEDLDGSDSGESSSNGTDDGSLNSMLEGETSKTLEENSRTMEKVCDLKERMEILSLQRKCHKTNIRKKNKEREKSSNLITKKPSCSLRLPSIQRDVKEEMFKSRSEFSQIPVLPDIITHHDKSTSRESDYMHINDETSDFDVCNSVRPKTCPGSLCNSQCYNLVDEVDCENSLGIAHPNFRSCISACSTKLHHEWSGRKSLLQSLNIPPPIATVTGVLNEPRKTSSSKKISSITTTVPSLENLNFDHSLLRSAFKSREILRKEDMNVEKRDTKNKQVTSFSGEHMDHPETSFQLWNNTTSLSSASSSNSSFCGISENTGNSDLLEPSINNKFDFDKKRRLRCSECNKKLSLTSTFECRCGLAFCSLHRYSETHNCSFDFKKDSRKILEQANPSVVAPKLPKI